MSKVSAASGSKYSAHNEPARKFEPIAPTGTSYTPVGRPDIAALRKTPAAAPAAQTLPAPTLNKPSLPAASRPMPKFGAPMQSAGFRGPRVGGSAPTDAWPEEASAPLKPKPEAVPPVAVAPKPAPLVSAVPVPSDGPLKLYHPLNQRSHRTRDLHRSRLPRGQRNPQTMIASNQSCVSFRVRSSDVVEF
jgi:hypothetical protein